MRQHGTHVASTGPGYMVEPVLRRIRPTLKHLAEKGAARLGYHLIPAWRMRTFDQARQLRHLLGQLQIDTVLDIGANEGGYQRLLRQDVGYTGRIVSFEPVPAVYATLAERTRGDPRWTGHRMALGDRDGELVINVTQRSTMSSFLARDETRLRDLGYAHLLKVTDIVRTEPVRVCRLDTVYDEVVPDGREARLFLKCDTQGFDMQVIAGAERSMARVMALQIELSTRPIYAGAPGYLEVLETMGGRGFDVAGIYPVRRDELGRMVNFDCVMINSRHPAVTALADTLVKGREPVLA
jgi:FkbM family methyltransferase